jgi:hypothetical protein
LHPGNQTLTTLFGGTSTASAGLQIFGSLNSGTSAVASVSARTSFAGLVVDNSGTGDIFTASSSGQTRLTIGRNGNVSIGTSSATEKLTVGGNIKIDAQPDSTVAPTKITQTDPGQIMSGGTQLIASISASAVYNGSLYVGTARGQLGGAEIYRYRGTNGSWELVSQPTPGTIASGGHEPSVF